MMKKVIWIGGISLLIIALGYFLIAKKERLFRNPFEATTQITPAPQEPAGAGDELKDVDLEIAGIKLGAPIGNYSKSLPAEIQPRQEKSLLGMEVFYHHYPGFTLKTFAFGVEPGETIRRITIVNPNLKTVRGIGIGARESEVRRQYGRPERSENIINYRMVSGDDEQGINFKIGAGKVTAIEVYYGANPFFANGRDTIEEITDLATISAYIVQAAKPATLQKVNLVRESESSAWKVCDDGQNEPGDMETDGDAYLSILAKKLFYVAVNEGSGSGDQGKSTEYFYRNDGTLAYISCSYSLSGYVNIETNQYYGSQGEMIKEIKTFYDGDTGQRLEENSAEEMTVWHTPDIFFTVQDILTEFNYRIL